MAWFPYVAALHVLGVILWVGGVLAAGHLMALRAGEPTAATEAAETRIFKSLAGPGLILAFLTGIALLSSRPGYYMHRGWFHAKLLLVFALVGFHMALRVHGKKSGSNSWALSGRRIAVFVSAAGISALGVLLLVFTQPF